MSGRSTKNYREADKWVISGELVVTAGGKLKLGDSEIKQATNVAKAAGTAPTKAEFDAVIDALVAAGLMAAPVESAG